MIEGLAGRSTDRPPTNSRILGPARCDTVADTWKWLQKEDPDWASSSRAAACPESIQRSRGGSIYRQHRLSMLLTPAVRDLRFTPAMSPGQ